MVRFLMLVSPVCLLALCSCATPPDSGRPLTYEGCVQLFADGVASRPRETAELRQAALVADITLLELDDDLLPASLSTISEPQRFAEPVGEALALLALGTGRGEVLLRPSLAVVPGGEMALSSLEERVYLADWGSAGGRRLPEYRTVSAGVAVGIRVAVAEGGACDVSVDARCSDVAQPMKTIAIEPDLFIQVPRISSVHRTANGRVLPGETAVFTLFRRGRDGRSRTTLLCIRFERRT